MIGLSIIFHGFLCVLIVLLVIFTGGREMFTSQYSESTNSSDSDVMSYILKIAIVLFFLNVLYITYMIASSNTDVILDTIVKSAIPS